jgi:hypothetical protein
MIFYNDDRLRLKLLDNPVVYAVHRHAVAEDLSDTETLIRCVLALIRQNDALSAELLKLHEHGLSPIIIHDDTGEIRTAVLYEKG